MRVNSGFIFVVTAELFPVIGRKRDGVSPYGLVRAGRWLMNGDNEQEYHMQYPLLRRLLEMVSGRQDFRGDGIGPSRAESHRSE